MPTQPADVQAAVREIADRWREERATRQVRDHLERADFDALSETGLLQLPIPTGAGGRWEDIGSARPLCELYRHLAGADPSVALVSAMHPAVVGVLALARGPATPAWEEQREAVFASALAGEQWGTITSEPGQRRRHRTHEGDGRADRRREPFLAGAPYGVTGDKHFGSGSGIADRMITTASPEGEAEPAIFVLDVRDRPWDGTAGLAADRGVGRHGHGRHAEPRHAPRRRAGRAPGVGRPARGDHPRGGAASSRPLFTAVVLGVLDEAVALARAQLARQGDHAARLRAGRVGAGRDATTGSRCRPTRVRCGARGRRSRRRAARRAAGQGGGRRAGRAGCSA